MKITVCDWTRGRLLEATAYQHCQTLEGTLEDVLRVAGELYAAGLNVMLRHASDGGDGNPGTVLWVDDRGFTQR